MLVCADTDLNVFETDFIEPSYSIKTELDAYTCAIFYKDSRKLIIGGSSSNLIEVDIYNKKKRICPCIEEDTIKCMTFNKNYDLLAVGTSNGSICIINYPEFTVAQTCKKYNFGIVGVVFANDTDILFGDSFGHVMRTTALSGYAVDYSKHTTKNGPITSMAMLTSGDLVVSSGKSVYVYDKYSEEVMHTYDLGTTAKICTLPGSPNTIIIGTRYGEIQIYNVSTESVVNTFDIDKRISGLAASASGDTIAASFNGGIIQIDLENTDNVMCLTTKGSNIITALVYQPQIIAIPEDALFTFGSSTQVWGSKSQLSKSRTGNSLLISAPFEEEEDYTVNKISFRKSILAVNTNSSHMSAGQQCLSRSGIDINSMSPRSKGGLSPRVSGSPSLGSISKNVTIDNVPDIANFPSRVSEQYDNDNDNASERSDIVSSPIATKASSVRFSPQKDENQTYEEEISLSGDHIDIEPIKQPENNAFDINSILLEKIDQIMNRLDALEAKSNNNNSD